MASFDPYRIWLGITPQEQPPNLYRLLGLRLFEDNVEAIESAVDQRLAYLRTKTTGPHGAEAERLIRQIIQARLVLMDDKRRAEYDLQLGAKAAPSAPETAGATPLEDDGTDHLKEQPETETLPGIQASLPTRPPSLSRAVGRKSGSRKTSRRRTRDLWIGVWSAALALLAVAVVVVWFSLPDRQPAGDSQQTAHSAGEATRVPASPSEPEGEEAEKPDSEENREEPPAGNPPGQLSDRESPDEPPAEGVKDEADAPSPPPGPREEPPVEPPSADVEKQITASLEKIFDLGKVGSQAEAQQRLQQLRAAVGDPGNTDDQRYVLLQLVGRQALLAGEVDALWDSWAQLTSGYLCDGGTLVREMLSGQRNDVYWITRATAESGVAISQACRQGKVEQAGAAIDTLTGLARAARPERATVALWCLGEARTLLNQAAEWYREYQLAQTRLGVEPDDVEAHRAAGRWLCLGADDWAAGLEHLAVCGDSVLAEAAKAEQSVGGNAPESLVAVADRWWQYAEKADRNEQPFFRAHAVQLYERALWPSEPPLSALEKARVEKLLAQPEAQTAKPFPEQIAAALCGGPSLREKWVELLPLTRLGMAPQDGKVIPGARGLGLAQSSGIYLPLQSGGSYDVKVVFTRLTGDDTVSVQLPVAGTGCLAVISGWHGQCHGICLIDGREANANASKKTPGKIPNGVPLICEIAVRVKEPLCSVQAALNRTPLFAWQGEISSLTAAWGLRTDRIGIHNHRNEATVVHSVSVRPLDDQAVLVFGD